MRVAAVLLVLSQLRHTVAQTIAAKGDESSDAGNRQFQLIEDHPFRSGRDADGDGQFTDILLEQGIVDYPTYEIIPKTSFSCGGKVVWHYYADVEAGCQSFHVCETEYSKISFLCPNGSVFNQRHLVCDWWYNVDCSATESLYALANDYNEPTLSDLILEDEDRIGFDLSLASSGGNPAPSGSGQNTPVSAKGSGKKSRRLKDANT